MTNGELNTLAHQLAEVIEAFRTENLRHSNKIIELDMQLASIKFKIQGQLGEMEDRK